jgi:hypothetical protein
VRPDTLCLDNVKFSAVEKVTVGIDEMTDCAWLIVASFLIACFLSVRKGLATVEVRSASPAGTWLEIRTLTERFPDLFLG